MLAAPRRLLTLFTLLILASTCAWADQWTKPTPEELQMTAEPAEPGASAIYLLRDERADDKIHIHTIYIRLKVLSEKGKDYADQEIDYEGGQFRITGVEGRTIHSDGTVIPFTGKPYQKLIDKNGKEKYKATVFSMPDVQVGSILEYRYVLAYDSNLVVSPRWFLQGALYTRKAHFYFLPSTHELEDGHGGTMRGHVAYSAYLPPGAKVIFAPSSQSYYLDLEKISGVPYGGVHASNAQLHLSRAFLLHHRENHRRVLGHGGEVLVEGSRALYRRKQTFEHRNLDRHPNGHARAKA